ncbi:MAG TPA: hypothetical protein VGG02_04560 [Chthoniobacterales bacterium]
MSTTTKTFISALAIALMAAAKTFAQDAATASSPAATASPAIAATTSSPAASATATPATHNSDLAPMTMVQASSAPNNPVISSTPAVSASAAPMVASNGTTVPAQSGTSASAGSTDFQSSTEGGGVGVREFQGDEVGQVLRLLARQAKINIVVSDAAAASSGTVTMRLEDVTALQAIKIIVKAKNLFMDQIDNVYYIKTAAERTAEPTESGSYQFSYSIAKDVKPLLDVQLLSKQPSQIDERTNTIFYRENQSNIDNIRKLLVQIDKPTKQVMIEARLVEVTANPRQSYGINWGGVFGGSTNPQTVRFGAPVPGTNTILQSTNPTTGAITTSVAPGTLPTVTTTNGAFTPTDFLYDTALKAIGGQFAILSVPQMSLTLQLLNEDSDAEFLANPRIVTADNMKATIEITRAQPVPQQTFNEQTAQSVFSGFQDKKYGNTLEVRPSVNKDDFVTLSVKPVISNKVGDQSFTPPGGAPILSPIIDTRSLESNVLIKSGDTLAIGGLLQDEVSKDRAKVPVLGDVPVLGYLFQQHVNARVKRNLLVFVTPTILQQGYGTGLEDQVSGLHNSGDEYADPNGWRNNARGAVRLVPTSDREVAADYPKPGVPPPPDKLRYMSTANERDQ